MQFHNGHFKKCNDWLAERYGVDEIIDWNLTETNNDPLLTDKLENQKEMVKPDDDENGPEVQPAVEADRVTKTSTAKDEFEEDTDALEALAAAEAAS